MTHKVTDFQSISRSNICLNIGRYFKNVESAAEGAEEGGDESGAVVGEDSGYNSGAGMERRLSVGRVAALGVGRADYDAVHLRPRYGSSAHQARLYGDIERAAGEVFAAEGLRRGRNGLHLGVGGDVGKRFGEVMTAPYNGAPRPYDNSAYRHLAQIGRLTGLVESHEHEALVVGRSGLEGVVIHRGL